MNFDHPLWDQIYDPEPWLEREEVVRIVPNAWDAELAQCEGMESSDLEIARANNGNPVFRPYLDRALKKMREK